MIDITGDQFEDYHIPAYVGGMDAFYRTFEFIEAFNYDGLYQAKIDSGKFTETESIVIRLLSRKKYYLS